jgi:hypothetical protein
LSALRRSPLANADLQISRSPDLQISRSPDLQISRSPDLQISRSPENVSLAAPPALPRKHLMPVASTSPAEYDSTLVSENESASLIGFQSVELEVLRQTAAEPAQAS